MEQNLSGTKSCKRISIEAGSVHGWTKYVGANGDSIGLDTFGKSAPYKKIYEHFKLTSEEVAKIARKLLT